MIEPLKLEPEAEYQDPGYGELARVPSDAAILVCKTLGYRIKYIEEGDGDVLLEPTQKGISNYPPPRVIPKPYLPYLRDVKL